MRAVFHLFVLLLVYTLGCGGSSSTAGVPDARETIRAAQEVFTDYEARSAGGEIPVEAVDEPLGELSVRLEQASHLVDEWEAEGEGELGWRTIAPCIVDALTDLTRALEAVGVPSTMELEMALARAEGESRGSCAD